MSEKTITLNITGMNCNGCANSVQRSISKLAGVQSVTVDLQQAEATVTYNPEQVNVGDMKERVAAAGYGVVDLN